MLVYRHTLGFWLSDLESYQKEGVASLGQPRQARDFSDNAPPHVRRQGKSVAVDEYEQRLPGSPGAPAEAQSRWREDRTSPEDKAIEDDRACAVFASVDSEGRRAGANGGGAGAKTCASTSADAHHKKAASGLRRPGPGHAGLDAAELAGPRAGAVGARISKQVVVARQHRGPAGRG